MTHEDWNRPALEEFVWYLKQGARQLGTDFEESQSLGLGTVGATHRGI